MMRWKTAGKANRLEPVCRRPCTIKWQKRRPKTQSHKHALPHPMPTTGMSLLLYIAELFKTIETRARCSSRMPKSIQFVSTPWNLFDWQAWDRHGLTAGLWGQYKITQKANNDSDRLSGSVRPSREVSTAMSKMPALALWPRPYGPLCLKVFRGGSLTSLTGLLILGHKLTWTFSRIRNRSQNGITKHAGTTTVATA